NGQIVLNDLPVDDPSSRDLPTLLRTLKRFKESADANRSEALVTIQADDNASHQRIVDVLNCVAKAGIKGVTFADTSSEQEM
ncbi:MAG: biopolymer transporter ExbD, partial [Chthoniobacterales bacterium]|nr:biopolymer transporter ExbD [Chthoniobacterales bacterium]